MNQFTRRKFIFTAGAAAAGSVLVNACSTTTTDSSAGSSSAASSPAAAGGVETTKARLGFIALTDSSPLIIAAEKGLFKKYGMTEVEVVKQASWPVTRDNLEVGSEGGGIDGAHILTPIPYLMSMGKTKSKQPLPMYILARLNTNGQAISIAGSYKDAKIALKSANLKEVLAKAKAGGKTDLKAAMTFPGGTHDMWLRYWLAANGVDPNKDLSVIPIPPPQMVANMKAGTMEMFCVGEPWNNQLVNNKIGSIATTTGEIWADHPEKAFAMRGSWVDKNPKAAQAITAAIIEAQQWCDKAENKEEMVKIVSDAKWFKVPPADILGPLQGTVNYGDGRPEVKNFAHAMKFWANNASYPYQSHDLWFLTENIRWGNIPATTDTKAMVKKVNKEDIWRAAAKQAGVAEAEIPTSTSRGVETFFDGVKFDPEKPEEYLKSLKIKAA